MAQFSCVVPFAAGETWVRRNFFSPDMKPIGADLHVLKVIASGLPAVAESAVTRTEADAGWGGKTPVVEIYLRLVAPAAHAGDAVVMIEVDLQGALVSCAEASDACALGSSG